MADAIIEVKDVEFRYEGAEEDAVAGVSLRVERGEFVAVLGRNGSGKSTLAKLLNALNIPQKGEIWIDGVAAHEEENSLEVRKKMRHGLPEPGQPDRRHRGGGGLRLWP